MHDIAWVQDFQLHLQGLDAGQSTNSTYTLEDAVYGLEYLFNYAYGDIQVGVNVGGSKTSFAIPSNNDWLELYNSIYNQIQDEKKSDVIFDFVSVEANFETNSIEMHTHYVLTNPDIVEYFSASDGQSFGCDNPPFTDQEFIFGDGGQNGISSIPDGCGPLPFCGENIACATPNIYALELIEAFYNADIRNNNFCKNDEVAAYTVVDDLLITIYEDSSISRIAANCPEIMENIGFPNGCSCASTDLLNCLSCHTENVLTQIALERIPEGYEILNVDLFTETVEELGEVYFNGRITFGTVTCVPNEREEPILVEICC